jgi:2-hydroxy-3-keto-5-methylthiopentenyl-1-phosphate phosphatase
MMDSVTKPYNECIDYLVENVELDPGFQEYFEWSLENKIPTVVVSSGMEPIIRAILKKLIGANHDKIDIISNDVEARPGKSINQEGGWQIKFHDERSVKAVLLASIGALLTFPQRLRPRQVIVHPTIRPPAQGQASYHVLRR